ncbi:MAG: recombinase family protein [Desulforhopalus sp.]
MLTCLQRHCKKTLIGTVRLGRCLEDLSAGDILIVWKLDRLGRSLPHLVRVVAAG